jgi:hypothetical protein
MSAEPCPDKLESHRNRDTNYCAKPSHQYARLPPELIDTIIGMLRAEQATLATCALVCRSWLPASRHLLFSHVTISPKKYSEIARLSAATREITLAVKHLTLEVMEDLGDLCKVICRLSNVTQLSIHSSIVTDEDFSQPAWVSLLQDSESLEFTNVEFDTPGTLLSLLFSSPQLRSLHCDYVTFMIMEDPDSGALQDVFMPELKLVYVNETNNSLCWIIARLAIAAPQVTTLVLDLDPYSEFDVSWEPLLKAVGSRLQDLQLSHVPEDIREFCETPVMFAHSVLTFPPSLLFLDSTPRSKFCLSLPIAISFFVSHRRFPRTCGVHCSGSAPLDISAPSRVDCHTLSIGARPTRRPHMVKA